MLQKRFVYFYFFSTQYGKLAQLLAVPVFILSPDSRAFCEESVSGPRLFLSYLLRLLLPRKYPTVVCNVGDPDPDPLVRGTRIRILPFSHKGVKRSEIMLAKF
jgi:hypothetical protein